MNTIFQELTVIFVLSALFAFVLKVLKLPSVLGYILVGILIGPLALFNITDHESFEGLAKIGITLLLFLLGLELKIDDLKSVGKIAIITGVGQIVFTSIIGLFIAVALGFSLIGGLYLAIGLTFSSTIVIVKLLSDKKELTSLHGRISVGFLLVQDFVAVLALVILSGLNPDSSAVDTFLNICITVAKASFLFALVIWISKEIVPKIIHKISHSQEILFIFSLAWAFSITSISSSPLIGLSPEIGGFLAGLALANSVESFQIVSKVRALRDFFITIFFVTLGMTLNFSQVDQIILPAIILSLFVLVGNPLIVMYLMKLLGYKKRTGFMCGLAVAQISEFSLIVATLGLQKGHFAATENITSILTIVAVVTFAISSYLFVNSERIYEKCKPYLSFFEKKNAKEELIGNTALNLENHIIIIGAHRMGKSIIEELTDKSAEILVVDFDPDIIKSLSKNGINTLFGDITDSDIQEKAKVEQSKLVLSTIPSYEDNIILIRSIKLKHPHVKLVVTTTNSNALEDLYKAGADFVLQPYAFVGNTVGDLLNKNPDELLTKLKRKRAY